ncbi:hypothetical protein ACWCQW_18415 [Streptomyces mirabilis]
MVAGIGIVAVVGATGITDHFLHEHRSEDSHNHGVIGGVLHGNGQ